MSICFMNGFGVPTTVTHRCDKQYAQCRLCSNYLRARTRDLGRRLSAKDALQNDTIRFSTCLRVALCIKYAVDRFVEHPVESFAAMNTHRLALGFSLHLTFE